MSMHFAPQWVKPIKPAGSSLIPTHEAQAKTPTTAINTTTPVPFPSLNGLNGSGGGHHTAPPPNPALSYSKATHTPTTPGFPADSSYFPYPETNGHGGGRDANPHPFRYSRAMILGLWDEDKVRETPIELVNMQDGGVLVSKSVVRPIGLRDLSDVEKKLLASSVHPPNPVRRQQANPNVPNDPAIATGPAPRRTIGGQAGPKEGATPSRGAGGAFGGFGRGEGGAFGGGTGKTGTIGGGLISPGLNGPEGRAPGALGGGFGGVGRRGVRGRTESGDTAWRPARTASGNFEGVLGFGGPATAVAAPQPTPTGSSALNGPGDSPISAQKETKEKEPEVSFGSGGGPGWGTGQKKWRIAAGIASQDTEKTLEVPISQNEKASESVAATPAATPMIERDATVAVVTPLQAPAQEQPAPTQEPSPSKEDLGAVEWYYRDPNGQEQGPFTGNQMHEWYSHSYFTDDLPLRRSTDTTFQSLAELKTATGNAVQPFLSAVRPRLPPNLPLPVAAAPSPAAINGVTDSLRSLGLGGSGGVDPRVAPVHQQPMPSFNQYMPERNPMSPGQFPQNAYGSPGAPFMQSPNQWGAPVPRLNTFGSVGMPSPIGAAPIAPISYGVGQPQQSMYSPAVGAPAPRDFFSPSGGIGAPGQPSWGMPSQSIPQQFQQPQHQLGQWGAPQFIQQHHQQQPPQQHQYQQEQTIPQSLNEMARHFEEAQPAPVGDEPSYFPHTEPVAEEGEGDHEESPNDIEEPEEEEHLIPDEIEDVLEEEEDIETAPSPVPEPVAPKAPVSAWGKPPSAPSSRKSSIAAVGLTPLEAASTPAPAKLPPAPASLPAKPVSATSESASATPEKARSTRPAPWADKEGGRTPSSGPSLREIQLAEAKEADARKAARLAASSPAPVLAPGSDEIPQSMSWGLPSSQKGSAVAAPTPTAQTPVMAWGGGDAAPKKTLKQIQEEEEKRKTKAAQASKTTSTATGPPAAAKRGYADLAAKTSQPPGAGWTTVGATKAATPVPATTSRPATAVPAKPVSAASIVTPKPVTAAAVKPKINGAVVDDSTGPSVEFIRWVKQALTGLNVNLDEFIQMLLSFPVDPPAASRPEVLEIISDSVYASSSTLDGRRFAQEFYTKRKADAARLKTAPSARVASGSLADVVKSVPKKVEQPDAGFRIVKAKGKKKN